MNINNLIKYLTKQTDTAIEVDPYWNDVALLCRFDKETNSRGLPLYRDYSRYQREIKHFLGKDEGSSVYYVDNQSGGPKPYYTNNADNTVSSYAIIPNNLNYNYRLQEINSNEVASTVKPTYLEIYKGASGTLQLGNSDFTIELSFYADALNLPRNRGVQTIFSAGKVNAYGTLINSYTNYGSLVTGGYSVQIEEDDVYFVVSGNKFKINASNLTSNTWYSICVERTGNNLKTYLNYTLTNTYTVNFNQTFTLASAVSNTLMVRASIGADSRMHSISGEVLGQSIDTAFSGGISNLRITKNVARYSGSFYSVKLPFILVDNANYLDTNSNNTLFNFPFNFDLFDYSDNSAHIKDKVKLYNTFVSNQTGYLYTGNGTIYETDVLNEVLSGSQWTVEFYVTGYVNGSPIEKDYSSFIDFLLDYEVASVYNTSLLKLKHPLLKLQTSNGTVPLLQIDWNVYHRYFNNLASYFSISATQNGNSFITYPEEANININENITIGRYDEILPSNEVKFGLSSTSAVTNMGSSTADLLSPYSEPNYHVAICRYNNNLYTFINGVLVKQIGFNYTLLNHSDLVLKIAGTTDEILGRKLNNLTNQYEAKRLSIGIKGVRVTNFARYNSVGINDYPTIACLQPLPVSSNSSLVPPRARISGIIKQNTNPSISSNTASWYVFVSQQVDNLVLADFTLAQTDGMTGASLSSIEKITEYQYLVTATTGTTDGTLALNFIDRRTVRYKGSTDLISNFTGELNFSGPSYIVNKSNPIPALSSSSSPYVLSNFLVVLRFDAAIETFDRTKIGVSNGLLKNVRLLDSVNQIYELEIQPVNDGPVVVQCMEGVGITDSGKASQRSAPLTRIFNQGFSILQTPLSFADQLTDYSPARHTLQEVIPNNTVFSNVVSPPGVFSSLSVVPLLEQSGAILNNFNALGSTFTSYSELDWTIEFFLRSNSSNNKFSHIFSVSGPNGFCIAIKNGKLVLLRNVTSSSSLFSNFDVDEKDTVTYLNWNDNSASQIEKYPHFAITKKGNVYRIYRNGKRIGLVQSNLLVDITSGTLRLGYYENRVNDCEYFLSNLRVTVGKALYTAYQVNIPALPYTIPTNISDIVEILDYISIYSTNTNSNIAATNDDIILKFNSIIELENIPSVTILGRNATVLKKEYNQYTAQIKVLDSDSDGEVSFSINIENENLVPDREFTNTTNNSSVIVDNTALTASIVVDDLDDNKHIYNAYITFSEQPQTFNLNNLTLSNCTVSNLIQIPNTYKYSFLVRVLTTGAASIQLLANTITDRAGNYNEASNLFQKESIVPVYVPDAHWNNVICLLQPGTDDIVDLSTNNCTVTNTNVDVTNAASPPGISTSMYFNGTNSSLKIDLNQTIPNTQDYTVEFYAYVSKSASYRLGSPTALPASEIAPNKFRANWEEVDGADSYRIDISKTANFTTYLPGYKQKEIEDAFLLVGSNSLNSFNSVVKTVFKDKNGVVIQVPEQYGPGAYKLDLSTNDDFTSYDYYVFSDNYIQIGDINVYYPVSPAENNYFESNNIAGTTIPLITGLVSAENNNYPKIHYFLDENTVRVYTKSGFSNPLVAEYVDAFEWRHIAIVNKGKFLTLYLDGEEIDRTRNVGFSDIVDVGYSLAHFNGYIQGLRITKGIARYNSDFLPPILPYGMD